MKILNFILILAILSSSVVALKVISPYPINAQSSTTFNVNASIVNNTLLWDGHAWGEVYPICQWSQNYNETDSIAIALMQGNESAWNSRYNASYLTEEADTLQSVTTRGSTTNVSINELNKIAINYSTPTRDFEINRGASAFIGFRIANALKWTIGRDATYGFVIFDDVNGVYRTYISQTTFQLDHRGNVQIMYPNNSSITQIIAKASGFGDTGSSQFTFMNNLGQIRGAFRYVANQSTAYAGPDSINFINVIDTPLSFGVNNGVRALFYKHMFNPYTDNDMDLGNSSNRWRNLYLTGNVTVGSNQGITLNKLINASDKQCWLNFTSGILTSSDC